MPSKDRVCKPALGRAAPSAWFTHEATSESAVFCLKDKKDRSDLKDTVFHDN